MPTLNECLDKLVDSEYGLIKHLFMIPRNADEPNIFVAMASIQNPLALPPRNTRIKLDGIEMKQGAGCGFTYEDCLWSTIGESIERYSAAIYREEDIVIASCNELGASAVNPLEFIRFSEEQYSNPAFQHQKPDPGAPIGWVKGNNVLTGEERFIPASMVYMYYVPLTEHDGKIDNGYSTGLAAGSSRISSIHSGLREVVERDAYALHWLTKRTAPKIDFRDVYEFADNNLRKLLEYPNLDIDIRDYTTELGIPCVLVHLRGDHFKGVASGSACNMSTYKCVEKAILESFHTLSWCIDMQKSGKPSMTLDAIEQYEHHVRYYFNRTDENKHNLDFMFADAPKSSIDFSADACSIDIEADLAAMVRKLDNHNYAVYAVDVTTDDVRDSGFTVTRVVVPGLQPLYCGIGNEHLDRRRINRFAESMGLKSPLALNTKPHPFP